MQLSILERILILNLDTLPQAGSIITMKIKQQLMADAGFTEEEVREHSIVADGNTIKWDTEKRLVKDVAIGEQARKLLIGAMDRSENLNEHYVPLYDRLMNEEASDGVA